VRRIPFIAVILTALLSLSMGAEARCDKEGWTVKTGTNSDAQLVDVSAHNVKLADAASDLQLLTEKRWRVPLVG
jgi:hypothetical protein